MSEPFQPIQRSVVADFSAVDSQAAAGVGNAVAGLAEKGINFAVAQERANQEKDLAAARLDATKQLDGLQDQFRTDTNPDTMAQRYSDAAAEIGKSVGGRLQGKAAQSFGQDFGFMSESRLHNIKDLAFDRQVQTAHATVADSAETLSRAAAFSANPAERESNVAAFHKSVDGYVSAGLYSPADAQKQKQTFDERLALFDGKRDVLLDPKATYKNLDNPEYLPALDPIAREELKNSADAEIRTREREARAANQMARLEAAQAASDLHTVIASGEPVAQSVMDAAVQSARASGDPKAIARVNGLVRAKGFADGLRGAAPREVDAGLAAIEAQANKSGADEAMAAAVVAARKFKENMNTQLAHDPMLWAAGQGVINFQPLRLDGTDAPAAFAQRIKQAQDVSRRYGVVAPPLSQAEQETLKTRLGPDQDSNLRLATLQQVVKGFGTASPAVLHQIGVNDPALAKAGTLLASGPAYVGTARDVLTGQRLLADKGNDGLRPTVAARAYAGTNNLMSAYSTPSLMTNRGAVLAGADALFAKMAAERGLRGADVGVSKEGRQLYQRALQLSAGARFDGSDTQFGGIGKYRGGAVLVPGDVAADGFEDLVHHFKPADLAAGSVNGQPPAWEGGEAPGNLVHRTWLISGGNGVYSLSATDPNKGQVQPVRDKSGVPFQFRFGAALASMQARSKAGR